MEKQKYIHDAKHPFKCEICGASFAQIDDVKKHIMKIHDGEKPFKYGISNIKMSSKMSSRKLVKQKQIEEKEEGQMKIKYIKRDYFCQQCDLEFDTNHLLNEHLSFVHDIKVESITCNEETKINVCELVHNLMLL